MTSAQVMTRGRYSVGAQHRLGRREQLITPRARSPSQGKERRVSHPPDHRPSSVFQRPQRAQIAIQGVRVLPEALWAAGRRDLLHRGDENPVGGIEELVSLAGRARAPSTAHAVRPATDRCGWRWRGAVIAERSGAGVAGRARSITVARPGSSGGDRSGEVEPVEFHDLGPGCNEVGHELVAGVLAGVDLREGS